MESGNLGRRKKEKNQAPSLFCFQHMLIYPEFTRASAVPPDRSPPAEASRLLLPLPSSGFLHLRATGRALLRAGLGEAVCAVLGAGSPAQPGVPQRSLPVPKEGRGKSSGSAALNHLWGTLAACRSGWVGLARLDLSAVFLPTRGSYACRGEAAPCCRAQGERSRASCGARLSSSSGLSAPAGGRQKRQTPDPTVGGRGAEQPRSPGAAG